MKKILLSEKIRRPPRFIAKEPFMSEQDVEVHSGPHSRYPRMVPLVVIDYGSLASRIPQMRHTGKDMRGSFRELRRTVKGLRDNPHAGKTTIDAQTLAELEEYAHSLGATDIGYTRVNPDFIFKDLSILYGNAIVFTMEMDYDRISTAPSIESFHEVHRTYHQLGRIVNEVSDFLRKRGFDCYGGPAIGTEANLVPLARDAGLGEVGKNGLLITEKNGPRVRLAAVYTNIENLPFATENPYAWVREYCEMCDACIKHCPTDAIYQDPIEVPEGGPAFIDHKLCAIPFSNDAGCTLCIKECPFMHRGRYGELRERAQRHAKMQSAKAG
jgi:Pyruvate/2-oxoacid:ferredoxin oxidoreductase delta subunit